MYTVKNRFLPLNPYIKKDAKICTRVSYTAYMLFLQRTTRQFDKLTLPW